MKSYLKLFTVAVTVLLFVGMLPTYVGAEGDKVNNQVKTQEQIEAEKARLRKLKEEMLQQQQKTAQQVSAAKCSTVQERVQNKQNHFTQVETKYKEKYGSIIGNLEKTSADLGEKGYSTNALDQDIATLKTMVEKFKSNYSNFKGLVNQLDDSACEEGEAAFLTKLEEVRASMQLVRTDAAEIRVFVKGELRQTLMDLKEEVNSEK